MEDEICSNRIQRAVSEDRFFKLVKIFVSAIIENVARFFFQWIILQFPNKASYFSEIKHSVFVEHKFLQ